MQNEYDIPTDRSLEEQQSNRSLPTSKTNCCQISSHLMIEKMKDHLAFFEKQFSRNIQWQKYLLSKVQSQHKTQKTENNKHKQETYKLSLDQQSKLREILKIFLEYKGEDKSLKTLINEAFLTLKSSQELLDKKEIQQPLQFPIVPRIVTLNDLNPASQRHLPSTLPPKTPKKKDVKSKKEVLENDFLTLTPKRSLILFSDSSSGGEGKNSQRSQNWAKIKGDVLGDSLGKRLFLESKENLIKIQQPPENQHMASQVSLTLSMSQQQKKPSIKVIQPLKPHTNSINYALESNNFEYESIYIQGPLENSGIREEQLRLEGLNFRDFPRRKIGKYQIKKENYFAYQEGGLGKVRKMHDSFGEAYQEYYLSESSTGRKESCLYRCQNTQLKSNF